MSVATVIYALVVVSSNISDTSTINEIAVRRIELIDKDQDSKNFTLSIPTPSAPSPSIDRTDRQFKKTTAHIVGTLAIKILYFVICKKPFIYLKNP